MAYSFRSSRLMKLGLRLIGQLLGLTALIFLSAHLAITYPVEAAAVKAWMSGHRYGWLAWRLMLYIATGWGVWKIWHAPGFRPEYRQPLLRMLAASGALIVVCELVLLRGGQ